MKEKEKSVTTLQTHQTLSKTHKKCNKSSVTETLHPLQAKICRIQPLSNLLNPLIPKTPHLFDFTATISP